MSVSAHPSDEPQERSGKKGLFDVEAHGASLNRRQWKLARRSCGAGRGFANANAARPVEFPPRAK